MQSPTLIVRNLLRQEWTKAEVDEYDAQPPIHTGWFGSVNEEPQITVTNPDETGSYESTDGETGEAVQTTEGMLLVNAWAGSRPTVENDADAATSNPKALAWGFRDHIGDVFKAWATGTRENGEPQLEYLEGVNARRIVDRDRENPVVRYEIETEYRYKRR